jgi:CBS domain-containing protein
MKEKVEEAMTRNVITVNENDSVAEVAQLFRTKKISGAPVLNDREEVVGVVSEVDIVKLLDTFHWYTPLLTTLEIFHRHGENMHSIGEDIERAGRMSVKEIMSKNPETVSPETLIDDAAQIMYSTGFNRLPVVNKTGKLVGIITRADIIASLYD